MKPKYVTQTAFVTIFLILIFISLTGCGSSATPARELSIFQLPDGSKIVVRGTSEMALSGLAGLGAGTPEDQAWLVRGEALVASQQPAGIWFTILNPMSFVARVTADPNSPGAIMLVNYDPLSGKFTLDCIRGICELGPDPQHLTNVPPNNQGSLDQSGIFQGPSVSDSSVSETYGNYIQPGAPVPTYTLAPTPTPSLTPTATLDLAATATAACQQFNAQFPTTPCP